MTLPLRQYLTGENDTNFRINLAQEFMLETYDPTQD